jgi:uncharacterized membrane protein YcaP (DUF421 family)
MFDLVHSAWEVVARTLIVYFALLAGLRFAGKRELGQMTPFDLVVILLIANAVQDAMIGPDTSITAGLIAAGVLLGVNYCLAVARDRVPWLRRAIEGTPTLLVNEGSFVRENMRKEGLDEEEVMMALREHGIGEVAEVRTAILEVDGAISIVPKSADTTRTRRHTRFLRRRL